MQKLIIYLNTPDFSTLSWIRLHKQQAPDICLRGSTDSLIELDKTQLTEIIVVAAPLEVLLTQVNLPKLNRQRLAKALPFALEEQLLTEVAELHFAHGTHNGGSLPVAVVTKTLMATWMNKLKELDLTPTAFIPAPLALSYTENSWHIKIMHDYALVRTGINSGFSCDKQNLATLLQLQLTEAIVPPQQIQVDNYSIESVDLPGFANLVVNDYPEKQFMLELAQINLPPALNLLQNGYQARRKLASSKPIWLRAGLVAAAWITLMLIGNIISFGILHHQSSQLQTAINKIYQQQFPNAKVISAPKQRMAEKLNQLTNQSHTNPLLLWLAQLGNSLDGSNIKIQQLEFNDNKLVIDIAAAKVDNIDVFTQNLAQQGLSVKQQNIITGGTQTTGTLIISDGSTA
jgi:general secretion pathway protein L